MFSRCESLGITPIRICCTSTTIEPIRVSR